MEGRFETAAGDQVIGLEHWSATEQGGRTVLKASGELRDGRARRWTLDAAVAAEGLVESMELQLTPEPPPTEVTTVALRAHGGRVFITRIPPGGVPERLETQFPHGSLVVGPSLALLCLLARMAPAKPGMGRRSLFLRLDDRDLSLRLEDGIVLEEKRVRGRGLDGREGWLRRIDLRTAADAARAEAVLAFDGAGNALGVQFPQTVPARAARP